MNRAGLDTYAAHWSRRDHAPAELDRLALTEPSVHRMKLLQVLADYLRVRAEGREGMHPRGPFLLASVQELAWRHEVSPRLIYRTFQRYRRGGLLALFGAWRSVLRRHGHMRLISRQKSASLLVTRSGHDLENAPQGRREA